MAPSVTNTHPASNGATSGARSDPTTITISSIIPGDGIANLKLGQSLYAVVNHLNEAKQPLKISYSRHDYLRNPVLVTVPNLGIRLMFNNHGKQHLILIEMISFEFMKVAYNGQFLNDVIVNQIFENGPDPNIPVSYKLDKTVRLPTLNQVYNKSFGPTYPGKLNRVKKSYTLSYPGIAFKFKIDSDDLLNKLADFKDDSAILSKLINWDRPTDISASSLAIFGGDNYSAFHRSKLLPTSPRTDIEATTPGPFMPTDSPDKFSNPHVIEKLSIDVNSGAVKVIFEKRNNNTEASSNDETTIKIGETTQQEILTILGPPDDYFNRFDSRLLIHNHLKNVLPNTASNCTDNTQGNRHDNSIYKFHNYFRYGLDFLYDLNPHNNNNTVAKKTGVLTKIIIHNGGITESLDFMRWNKCNWEILEEEEEEEEVVKADSSMYFNEIPSDTFIEVRKGTEEEAEGEVRPVLLNRNESEFIDDDLEVIQADDVSTSKSTTASVSSSSSNNLKTWGQSKLYGYERCILEVVESNNCISCVTIY